MLAVSDGVIGRHQRQCMLSSRPTMVSILWREIGECRETESLAHESLLDSLSLESL